MKKKSHYFELYITRMMKQISDKNTLTLNTKQHLNNFICIFINRLATDILKLLGFVDRKICTTKEVSSVLHILFSFSHNKEGDLLKNCILEGEKAVQKSDLFDETNNHNKNHVSKNNKAGILFPPTLIEKMLKQHHITISHISKTSVFIAAVCEYIMYEILDVTVIHSSHKNKKRITVKDVDLAIKQDIELSSLLNVLNTSLIVTQEENLILAKSSFERLIRQNVIKNTKLPKATLTILQTYIETYIIDLLRNASYLASHANRIKLLPTDIKLIYSIIQKKPFENPYIKNSQEIEELLMI